MPKRESEHLFRVFRAAPGDKVEILDGRGGSAIAGVVRKGVLIAESAERAPEPRRKLHLYCALPRRQKLDDLLKQSAELGVWSFHPVTLERSVARGEPRERWETLLQEGCKQSKNPFLPRLCEPLPLEEALIEWKNSGGSGFYGAVSGGVPEFSSDGDLSWFVGPEGGFSPEEERRLVEAGVHGLNLGPYVLRLETAAVAGLAVLRQWMMRGISWTVLLLLLLLAGCGQENVDRNPLMKKGDFYRENGDPLLARKFYRRLLGKFPDSAQIHLKLGTLADEALNDPLRALYHYNEFLMLAPGSPDATLVEGYRLMARAKLKRELDQESLPKPPRDAYDEISTENRRLKREAGMLKRELLRLQRQLQSPPPPAETGKNDSAPDSSPRARTYTVRSGDVPGRIARDHNVDVRDLMTENGLTSVRGLRPGQVLKIPEQRRSSE